MLLGKDVENQENALYNFMYSQNVSKNHEKMREVLVPTMRSLRVYDWCDFNGYGREKINIKRMEKEYLHRFGNLIMDG